MNPTERSWQWPSSNALRRHPLDCRFWFRERVPGPAFHDICLEVSVRRKRTALSDRAVGMPRVKARQSVATRRPRCNRSAEIRRHVTGDCAELVLRQRQAPECFPSFLWRQVAAYRCIRSIEDSLQAQLPDACGHKLSPVGRHAARHHGDHIEVQILSAVIASRDGLHENRQCIVHQWVRIAGSGPGKVSNLYGDIGRGRKNLVEKGPRR
jgi:hypothetical protein